MESPDLEYEITGLLGHLDHPMAPEIEPPGQDLLINAIDVSYADGELSLTLLITACFAKTFVGAFHRFAIAPVILVEDAGAGTAVAVPTVDPHKRYPRMEGPNFSGDAERIPESPPGGEIQVLQGIQMPLAIKAVSTESHPGIYITCVLQHHVSNTLVINLKEEKIASYRYGKPHRIEFAPVPEVGQDSGP